MPSYDDIKQGLYEEAESLTGLRNNQALRKYADALWKHIDRFGTVATYHAISTMLLSKEDREMAARQPEFAGGSQAPTTASSAQQAIDADSDDDMIDVRAKVSSFRRDITADERGRFRNRTAEGAPSNKRRRV